MKILIVRIGRLGDIVMILPAIAEIQRQYPNADIYALTSQDGVRLLKAYGLNPNHIHHYNNQFLKRPKQIRKVHDFLQYHHFDKIFCFEQKKRTVSWLPNNATVIDDRHINDHYALRCLKLINPEPEPIQVTAYLPINDYDISAQLSQHGVGPDTILIGLHPTYSGFNKWGRTEEKKHRLWPVQSFIDLVSEVTEYGQKNHLDIRFIVDLIPEEKPMADKLNALCPDNFIIQCEPPNFQRFLAYINRLNVLVAPNTGVMHLAAALNTPTVALFSGADPSDCGPYMHPSRYRVVHSEQFDSNHAVMANIPVRPVVDAVKSLLGVNAR